MRNKGKLCIFAATCAWLAAGAPALLAQEPSFDPQAEQALRLALEAHGGEGAVAALGDTLSQGILRIAVGEGFEESGLTVRQGGIDRLRTLLDGPGERRREYVRDGRFAWWVEDGRKRPQTEGRSANLVNPYNPATGILLAFLQGQAVAQGVEQVQLGGRMLLRVDVLLPDSRPRKGGAADRAFEVLIDAETMLVAELAAVSRDWDRSLPGLWERYAYSDYRPVEGVMSPFRIEMHRFGRLWSEALLESIGPAPPGDAFREPDAAEGGQP